MQEIIKSLNYLLLLQLNSDKASKAKHCQAYLFLVEELTKL